MLRELKLAIRRFGESAIGTRQRKIQFPGVCGDNRPAQMVQLEERVLYSAAPMDAPQEPVFDVDMVPEIDVADVSDLNSQPFEFLPSFADESNEALVGNQPASELIIVDTGVDEYSELVEGIISEGRGIEIVFLQSEQDGIEQITDLLSRFTQLDAIHFVSLSKCSAKVARTNRSSLLIPVTAMHCPSSNHPPRSFK